MRFFVVVVVYLIVFSVALLNIDKSLMKPIPTGRRIVGFAGAAWVRTQPRATPSNSIHKKYQLHHIKYSSRLYIVLLSHHIQSIFQAISLEQMQWQLSHTTLAHYHYSVCVCVRDISAPNLMAHTHTYTKRHTYKTEV